MKVRILSGLVGSTVLLVILFLLPPVCLTVALSIVCMAAAMELLTVSGLKTYRWLTVATVLFAGLVPFFGMLGQLGAFAAVLAYTTLLLCIQLKYHASLQVQETGFIFFSTLLVSLSLSCMGYLRTYNANGLYYVLLAFVIPWTCDIGAYFTGTFFGKHKLCPTISPKKTVEGLIGGIFTSILCSLLSVFIYQNVIPQLGEITYWRIGLAALLGAPVSVVGDLFASIIKRQYQVKDFGKFLPGHGGVIDRFDSLILTTPLLFLMVVMLS